jgi:hypothetical protein
VLEIGPSFIFVIATEAALTDAGNCSTELKFKLEDKHI